MEFWGVEVKSGEVLKVNPGEGMVLHLSQACLGEMKKKKGSESVFLSLNVDGKQLVLGTLFTDKLPQQQFDIVFDRYFELSHSWKSGSVYFCGYRAENPVDDEDESPDGESDGSDYNSDSDSDSEEDDIPLIVAENGIEKQVKAVENEKPNATNGKDSDASKQKVKIVEPEKAVECDDDTSDDDTSGDDTSDGETSDDDTSDGETSDDDLMSEDEDDEEGDDDDDEFDDCDEETTQKAVPSKKRAGDSVIETPVPEKKAKVTPQKTDGKKVTTHVDTPHPSKQAGKKTTGGKLTSVPEKPWGAYSCGSCNKRFNSDMGLESHNKAKHAGGK